MVTVTEVPCSWKGAAPGTEKASRFGTTKPGAKEKRDTQRTRWRKNRKGMPGSVSQAGQWHLDTHAAPLQKLQASESPHLPPEGLPPSRSSTHHRQASEGTVGVTAAAPRCPPGPAPALLPESGRSSGSSALPGPETKGREERAGLAARPLPRAVTELTTPGPTLPPLKSPSWLAVFRAGKNLGAARGCPGDDPGTALESLRKGANYKTQVACWERSLSQHKEQSRAGKEFQSIGKHTFRGCKWGEMVLQICRDEPLQRPPSRVLTEPGTRGESSGWAPQERRGLGFNLSKSLYREEPLSKQPNLWVDLLDGLCETHTAQEGAVTSRPEVYSWRSEKHSYLTDWELAYICLTLWLFHCLVWSVSMSK